MAKKKTIREILDFWIDYIGPNTTELPDFTLDCGDPDELRKDLMKIRRELFMGVRGQ